MEKETTYFDLDICAIMEKEKFRRDHVLFRNYNINHVLFARKISDESIVS